MAIAGLQKGLAARLGTMGGWKNPYVTDGLIAMWDGEWNAGGGIHDANATVWKDLSGNEYDYALYSGPTWESNCIYCAASYGAGGIGAGITIQESVVTMECVVEAVSYVGSSAVVMAKDAITSSSSNPCIVGKRGLFEWGYAYSGFPITGILYSFSSVSGAVGRRNNIEASVSGYDTWGFNGKFSLMGDARSSNYNVIGRMFTARIYNRALTAAEVAANYAIDKARFGLT